jgi:hypothetical protein
MELNKIEELTSEIPAEQRRAVLKLIDLKTNEDMKEIIKSNEMLKESINLLKENIKRSEEKSTESIKHLEGKMDSQIRMLMWAIGFLASLLVALKFIKY